MEGGLAVKRIVAVVALLAVALSALSAPLQQGTLLEISVHGPSLEGNLEGNSPDRTVFVYVPPGYDTNRDRRYPVVYNLHGYTSTARENVNYLGLPDSADRAIAAGAAEMILVFPDAMTVHGGSMYSSSVTVGDWEAFIAEDLTKYIDSNFRTLAKRESRGLSGHSMGGYGTLRIGMKYPDVYGALYPMSACCLTPRLPSPTDSRAEAVKTVKEAQGLDFFARTLFASSAAWSPNPGKPPFFFNLPTKNGEPQPAVYADYAAGALTSLIHQYVPELKSYAAIGIEIGDEDFLLGDNTTMHALMTSYGVGHSFETYDGDHVNRLPQRFEGNMLPFFSEHFETNAP
jgi:enterochelin esterase-like enzyme